jgi:plasmid maintenance system antidote protein VapI
MIDGPTIDLNRLHHAAHQITGDMALKFNKAVPADLERWAAALRALADQMTKAASEPRP